MSSAILFQLFKTREELARMAALYCVDVDAVPVYTRYLDVSLIPATVFFFNATHIKVDWGQVCFGPRNMNVKHLDVFEFTHTNSTVQEPVLGIAGWFRWKQFWNGLRGSLQAFRTLIGYAADGSDLTKSRECHGASRYCCHAHLWQGSQVQSRRIVWFRSTLEPCTFILLCELCVSEHLTIRNSLEASSRSRTS